MARDLFEEKGINANEPRDLFAQENINIPQVNQTQQPQGQPGYQRFLESQPENPMQSLEPFGGGGEPGRHAAITGAALAIPQARMAKYIPEAGNILKYLANVGGYAGQSGALGGAVNALEGDNIGKGIAEGALLGGGLSAAAPLVKKAYGAGKNTINAIHDIYKNSKNEPIPLPLPEAPKLSAFEQPTVPQLPSMQKLPDPVLPDVKGFSKPQLPQREELPQLKLPEPEKMPSMEDHIPTAPQAGNELLEKLGQGAVDKEQSATKAAAMLREKHAERKAESGQFFKHVFQQAGKDKLYEHVDPLITTAMNKEMDMMNKLEGLNVKPLFQNFKNDPTIHNAHLLKSELGDVVGDLQRNTAKSLGDIATIENINGVRKTLEDDILKSLERHDKNSNENLTPMYQRGVNFHRENVAPYRATPELRDITVKGIATPKNIEKIFDTPSNIFDKEGKENIGHINKIISDLPPEFKDLILHNKIGASQHHGQSEKLLDALSKAENEGYSKFFNPHVQEARKDIAQKIKNDIQNKAGIESLHKEALKERDMKHKIAISEAKAEHARITNEIKQSHNELESKAKLEHKARIDSEKAEHKLSVINAKLEHTNLTKNLATEHKLAVDNVKLAHKAHSNALLQEHKLRHKQSILEHRLQTKKIEAENALNQRKYESAVLKRNWLTGAALSAAGLGLAGGLHKGYTKLTSE